MRSWTYADDDWCVGERIHGGGGGGGGEFSICFVGKCVCGIIFCLVGSEIAYPWEKLLIAVLLSNLVFVRRK